LKGFGVLAHGNYFGAHKKANILNVVHLDFERVLWDREGRFSETLSGIDVWFGAWKQKRPNILIANNLDFGGFCGDRESRFSKPLSGLFGSIFGITAFCASMLCFCA
jgi:hypothetical protein